MIDTNVIRQRVDGAVAADRGSGEMRQLLWEQVHLRGLALTETQMTAIVEFIHGYLQTTADVLDVTIGAAQDAGATEHLQTIIAAVAAYWDEPLDFIPDEFGLLGMVDDAYLSWRTMQYVDLLHEQQCGRPLLTQDLEQPNTAMRALIGEPMVSQLDDHVMSIVTGRVMEQAITGLASFAPSFRAPAVDRSWGGCTLDEYVDTQIGAMGVI